MSIVVAAHPVPSFVVDGHVEAIRKALDAVNGTARRYYGGVALGYLIGMGVATRDALVTVRSAGCPAAPLDNLDPARRNPLVRDAFVAGVGIMTGYAESTAHRPDAYSCTACGNRIVLEWDEHTTCGDHGYLCGPFSGDCSQQTCTRRCWES